MSYLMNKSDMDFRLDALKILMPNGFGYSGTETEFEIFPTAGEADEPDPIPDEETIAAKVKELKADHKSKEYQRKRVNEYPSMHEMVVAMYDTDDKAALETKRAAVKTKWPKDNSGPVE